MLQQSSGLDSDSDSSSSEMVVAGTNIHASLFRLYKRLGTELTAFDIHKTESTPWEVKYAPENISEVLQDSREKEVLKE